MTEDLICDVCGDVVEYDNDGTLFHLYERPDHPARLRVAVPFPAGSTALTPKGIEVSVLAANEHLRWVKRNDWPCDPFTMHVTGLRPIPVKIAEPLEPLSVVWDDGVQWIRHGLPWIAWVDGDWLNRFSWDEFSDTVVLATPPDGAS